MVIKPGEFSPEDGSTVTNKKFGAGAMFSFLSRVQLAAKYVTIEAAFKQLLLKIKISLGT